MGLYVMEGVRGEREPYNCRVLGTYWLEQIVKAFIKTGRHCYIEPEPDGWWTITVDHEHEVFLVAQIHNPGGT